MVATHDHKPYSHPAWHSIEGTAVLAELETTLDGLDPSEAARRFGRDGANELPRGRRDGPATLFLRQIRNPLIWVLLVSAALAMFLGKRVDGVVVLAVVIVNTCIGFLQEYRAGRAIEALSAMVPVLARVRRSGEVLTIPARDLVAGDIVLLASGDRIPADLRVIECRSLRAEEAPLTGESVPVEKDAKAVPERTPLGDRRSMLFGGTLVTQGTGVAVVTETGERTELGRISHLLEETVDIETPLTRSMAGIGRVLTIGILVLSAVMFAVGILRAHGEGVPPSQSAKESLLFAIALAVGAIPEGLPAIVTIALAIGVQRMASRRAIVRKLPAVETLGSTTLICTDKTGTLTRNEMTVQEVWCEGEAFAVEGVGYEPVGSIHPRFVGERTGSSKRQAPLPDDLKALLRDAALCSDATLGQANGGWSITGDPTEAALVVVAEKAGMSVVEQRQKHPRIDVVPFESQRGYMASLHADQNDPHERRLIIKGGPEILLRRSLASGPAGSPSVEEQVRQLAARGLRVLAVASKRLEQDRTTIDPSDLDGGFRFLGLVGMIDPPRREAIDAVRACAHAGIEVKMITGDHRITAEAIGREIGLASAGQQALSGADLEDMDEPTLRSKARLSSVFARVAPEQKLALVQALQADGEIVAMTGDGVNDAPALKQANIGVAMGITGTDASKQAADIVLTDDNFATIVAAIEEGRRVYDNLVKSLAFVLPTNLGLAFILLYAVVFLPYDPALRAHLLPIAPTQLLWINLVATIALALPLAFEAREPDVMRRPPRDPKSPILSPFVLQRTTVVAVLMTAGAIVLFGMEFERCLASGMEHDAALREAQTIAVTTVIAFQTFYLLNCRSLKDPLVKIGLFSNRTVFLGIAVLAILQALFIYAPFMNRVFGTMPLTARDLLIALAAGASIFPVISVEKWVRSRRTIRPSQVRGGR